ncbi:MAG TPA: hypothetical protein VEB68_00645 [Croceibacterium sp.]|nr:hypothetical protein [Croceibacterium sp.]
MANESKHAADYSIGQLELNLQGSESIRQAVTSISATKNQYARFTKAAHDYSKPVPKQSLRLALDPNGNAGAPSGQTLVCRGTAWIDDVEQKVAVFRTN